MKIHKYSSAEEIHTESSEGKETAESSETDVNIEVTNNDEDEDLVSAAETLASISSKQVSRKSLTPDLEQIKGEKSTLEKVNKELTINTAVSDLGVLKLLTMDNNLKHPLVSKVTKVSKHPLVTNAVKYYENSKRNNSTFNYAAEFVEKAAMPVVSKIEDNLNHRYQVKQLRNRERKLQHERERLLKRRKVKNDRPEIELSIETKKRIKFLLHLLRLANIRISEKVDTLQRRMAEANSKDAISDPETLTEAPQNIEEDRHISKGSDIGETKTDIILTVKKIIKVITNFRPSSLSADSLSPVSSHIDQEIEHLELKTNIRDIILKLSNTFQQVSHNNNTSSLYQNEKIVLIATESLEMISKLTNVFNVQLEKAEQWIAGEEGERNIITRKKDGKS